MVKPSTVAYPLPAPISASASAAACPSFMTPTGTPKASAAAGPQIGPRETRHDVCCRCDASLVVNPTARCNTDCCQGPNAVAVDQPLQQVDGGIHHSVSVGRRRRPLTIHPVDTGRYSSGNLGAADVNGTDRRFGFGYPGQEVPGDEMRPGDHRPHHHRVNAGSECRADILRSLHPAFGDDGNTEADEFFRQLLVGPKPDQLPTVWGIAGQSRGQDVDAVCRCSHTFFER